MNCNSHSVFRTQDVEFSYIEGLAILTHTCVHAYLANKFLIILLVRKSLLDNYRGLHNWLLPSIDFASFIIALCSSRYNSQGTIGLMNGKTSFIYSFSILR